VELARLGSARLGVARLDKAGHCKARFFNKEKTMEDKKQTIPEMSADARILIALLQKAEVGEVITYDDMSNEIQRDVRLQARSALYTAIKNLKKEHLLYFDTVRNVGLKRLSTSAIANGVPEKSRQRIKREAKRGIQNARCAFNGDPLSREDMVKLNTGLSFLGIVAECSKPKTQKLIEEKVKAKSSELAIGETLSLMK
jgi:hypothetical protein